MTATTPDRAGPDRAGPDGAGPDRAGPDRAGPDRTGDVDLDVAPPSSAPAHRRQGLLALCTVVGLALVLGSAALHTALSSRAEPARAAATYSVLDLVATPAATVLLEVTVTNRGDTAVVADTVQLSGAGLAAATTAVQRRIDPGGQGAVTVRAPLDCTQPYGKATPPRVVVQVRPDGDQLRPAAQVVAVGVDGAAQVGWLCSQAALRLASGANPVLTVQSAAFDGPLLRLSVSGAPDGADLVTGRTAGWLLPTAAGQGSLVVTGGRLDAVLEAPSPGCRDTGALDVVPSGVQLVMVAADGGLISRYVPVGPELAGWLLDAYDRACPPAGAG